MILVMLPLIDFIMFGNMDVLPFGGFGMVEAMSQVNSVVPVGLMVVVFAPSGLLHAVQLRHRTVAVQCVLLDPVPFK